MAIFRFNPTILFAVFSLACITRESAPEAAPAVLEEAKIQKIQIEHVIPKRDFVGKAPALFEWTAAEGADSYAISLENEIEIIQFEQDGIKTTSVAWPKELKLDPGTYFWRVVGLQGARVIADSGRAAFVLLER